MDGSDAYDFALGLASAPIDNIEEHVLPDVRSAGKQNEIWQFIGPNNRIGRMHMGLRPTGRQARR